ncbi:hypothetical protein LIER_14611 [Lithospermum erythrorhizon]|uniref:Uncharacterized protein n=1 Tax=Lithospermum erythrorhizon TaxID=34254 RepID=A0AAV3Q1Q8_LITER
MVDDFVRQREHLQMTDSEIMHQVLLGINDTLKSLGKEVNDYHIVPFAFVIADNEELTRELSSERAIPVPAEDLNALHKLNLQ